LATQARPAILLLLAFTLLTGLIYPVAVTGIARVAFPVASEGSLIVHEGRVRGSSLIGQPFASPGYFWGRPSATSPYPYNAAASGGSNLGPSNPDLLQAVQARVEALREAEEGSTSPTDLPPVPVDLVTASASGLDPHISPAAAHYQVARVAGARGLDRQVVRALVEEHTEGRQFGLLGESRVNVLELNLALDALAGGESSP
jgi:K+-transporting ATPase ATPase C chain